MHELDGRAAFQALKGLIETGANGDDWRAHSPAIERLRQALVDLPQTASTLDLAVMMRQALNHEHARIEFEESPRLRVAHPRLMDVESLAKAALNPVMREGAIVVAAAPWRPQWLESDDAAGVDAYSASEVVRRAFNSANSEGDPFLASVGRQSYRSPGQRAAVRAALSTPAGAVLVVALPTGEGKSLIFQLVHSVGFVASQQSQTASVTLVIVPTVALAVNHEQEALRTCGLSGPLAYQGGSDAQNTLITERIATGAQGLCFASPEAATGPLRNALRAAAQAGHLRALVVDEAHLVEQWGTGFRTEFQELGALRRELLTISSVEGRMRTLLLSATLTDASLEALRDHFGDDDDPFDSIAAVRLRPEPDYWIAAATDRQTRDDRIMEVMHHAPRPMVLYVTEVRDADSWHQRLLSAGFKRVAKLHGGSDRAHRETVVKQWRDGRLDVVVGTSAFGLGIDYAHARAIVHACVPETLDRFYQEVGRGGRDGCAALSLIVPATDDFEIAKGINSRRVIGITLGRSRWQTMFANKVFTNNDRFAVRLDQRAGTSADRLDMEGETNTDWNLRVLMLMSRAKILRLLGAPQQRVADEGDWMEVEVSDDGHLYEPVWRDRVEPVRLASWRANARNLELMRAYLEDAQCPADIFEDLYGADRLSKVCSRCSLCRRDSACRRPPGALGEPRGPWTLGLGEPLARLFDDNGRLLVLYDASSLARSSSRRLGDALARAQRAGLAKLLVQGKPPFDLVKALAFAEQKPFFVSRVASLAMSRLPVGPELVLIGEGQVLLPESFVPRAEAPRIFLVPREQLAPDGRRLRDVFGGRTMSLDDFFERVAE